MTWIRDRLFRFADEVSMAVQNAGKVFGFLPDDRELVDAVEGPEGWTVTLSDRADEGWPEVRLSLPGHVSLDYAATGPLTRMVAWRSPEPVDRVRTELGIEGEVSELAPDTTMKVRESHDGGTVLIVRQTRPVDAAFNKIRRGAEAAPR